MSLPKPTLNPDPDSESASDSDFDPSAAPVNRREESSSSSESDSHPRTKVKRRRLNGQAGRDAEAEDVGFENSGDEATIKKGKKRKMKEAKTGEEDSGGEGGVVRTRAMRREGEAEKKPLASLEGATVDVDEIWKSMNHGPVGSKAKPPTKPSTDAKSSSLLGARESNESKEVNGSLGGVGANVTKANTSTARPPSEDVINIKRTYVFAGETITEEKLVPKSSAEARLFLESQQKGPSSTLSSHPPLRRPKKRVSKFEPNPEGIVKGLMPSTTKGPKLNTIEKSKLDWAGFVDKEGIKEELDVAEKAKDGYLGRFDFLGRVEAKREEELRNARTK